MHKWKDVQRQWIAALRSGEYKQGSGKLAEGGRYCCLGVACHVLYGPPPVQWHADLGALPIHAAEDLGMITINGHFGDPVRIGRVSCTNLVNANDRGATFLEIADFIEANPEKLFVQEAS